MTAPEELPEEHELDEPGQEVEHHPGHAVERKVAGSNLDLLRNTIAPDLNDGELALFAEVANRAGLDPFTRQIHAVKRRDSRAPGGHRMTIQVGIDGLRLIARRTGQYAGRLGPYFADASGTWRMMPDGTPLPWLDQSRPAAAMVGVRRKGDDVTTWGIALWSEYGEGNGQLWATIPMTMLAKVAEAQALRACFPGETAGLYVDEEMDQATTRASGTSSARRPASSPAPAGGPIDPWNARPGVVAKALRDRGIDVAGKIEELRQRLADALASEGGVIDVPSEEEAPPDEPATAPAADVPQEAAQAAQEPRYGDEPMDGAQTPVSGPEEALVECNAAGCEVGPDESSGVWTEDDTGPVWLCAEHATADA